MRRLLVAMAALLLSVVIGGAQEKSPVVQAMVQAAPEKIKKAALACRDVHTLILLPGDRAISVTMHWDTVCHVDGGQKIWNSDNEKDIKLMQTTLADLKAKIEKADQRH